MRILLPLTLLAACAVPDELLTNETTQDVDTTNGTSLNGTSLNGTSLNGTSLNGTSLNGTSLNGTSLNGTSISATNSSGPPLTGTGPVGSTWSATTYGGGSVNLRIDTALQGSAPNADLWFYGVSYYNGSAWAPLCGVDGTNAPIKAVTVAGVWSNTGAYSASSSQFTWACRGKTIGKCVELGYKTFKGYSDRLATCVRLLRADYCGTGTSYTVDGTLLNLYDNIVVQADTEATWTVEGEWNASGATCVSNAGYTRFAQEGWQYPPCLAQKQLSTCGTFRTGTLMIDELPPLSGTKAPLVPTNIK